MTNVMTPVAEGLFTWPSEAPRLIASRDDLTGAVTFPAQPDQEQVLLSRTGTLFTWTSQEFVPPSPPYTGDTDPASFQPYALGYVEFPEGILVEGRLTESDPQRLAIGQPMEVVVVPFRRAPGPAWGPGQTIVTFAFAPAAHGAVR